MTSYLDFDIEIDEGAGREYRVSVRSPAGEARATMRFPFDDLVLENRLLTLQNVLLRSGGKRRLALSQDELTVQEFGKALFDSMLVDDARSLFYECRRLADQRGAGMRVRLCLASPTLAALPWEFLYDPRQGHVSLSTRTPVVRYLELPKPQQPQQPLAIAPPLRILGMVASPSDLPDLDLGRERTRLERATAPLRDAGLVELVWLEGQTWRDLQRALRRGPWHVFHFAGHGAFDPHTDEGLVMLAGEEGRSRPLRATELGRLLADHLPLRLVVLNACEGARGGQRDIFSSTASILVRAGLPAVVAMQYEITNDAAIELTHAFYEALADEMPVEAALVEARKAVSLAVANSFEWGTPVLTMRAPDGVLFELAKAPARPVPTPAPSEPVPQPTLPKPEPTPAPPPPASRPGRPSLALTLLAPEAPVRAGEQAAWTVVVTNDGDETLRHVTLDRGKTPLRDPFDLKAGEERRITFQVRYTTGGGKTEKVTSTAMAADGAMLRQEAATRADVQPKSVPPEPPAQAKPTPPPRQPPASEPKKLPAVIHIAEPFPLELIRIPAGEFLMGSKSTWWSAQSGRGVGDEGPQHTVYLDDFYIARYPISNLQYDAFVRARGYQPPRHWQGGQMPPGKENHPVVTISWDDASVFCNWLAESTGQGFRLLTEAEWEKAASWDASQNKKRIYPWGDRFDKSRCNSIRGQAIVGTTPVGTYSLRGGDSPFGVADMAGNVWEWTGTLYRRYPYDPHDGREDVASGDPRVLRGGSFVSDQDQLRCAYRNPDSEWLRNENNTHYGLRVGMSLATPTNQDGASEGRE